MTELEFLELIAAITKPIDSDQCIAAGGYTAARNVNRVEAVRAAHAVSIFFEKKRQEMYNDR